MTDVAVASRVKKSSSVIRTLYPEYDAGGFSREDNSIVFYTRVQGLLSSDMTVLDFGAGTNIWANSPDLIRHKLMRLQGACHKVVGVDPEPGVADNPWLDEAHQIVPGERLPFEDSTFDMIVSFCVLEHIKEGGFVASEIDRILKPGGWFCAFTPNRWGYVGIGARLIPNKYHAKLLSGIFRTGSDLREDDDVYPVHYNMNTMKELISLFPAAKYDNYSYYFKGPPNYHGERLLLAYLFMAYELVMPKSFGRYLHLFFQKR